jgi:precorrin-6B methylase 2
MQLVAYLLIIVLMTGVALVYVVHLVAAQRNAVPPVFTPARAIPEVVASLDLPQRGTLVDVGCGDGRLLEAALEARPELRVVGVENNPVVWLRARLRLGRRAKLVLGQLEDLKLEQADRVFAYLGPGMMKALEPRFEHELRAGARVVSQQFPLPGRKPDRVIELAHGKPYAKRIYVYDY